MAQQLAGQLGVGNGGRHLGGVRLAVGQQAADLTVGADAGRLYLVMGHLGDEIGEAEGPGRSGHRRAQERRERQQQPGDHQPRVPRRPPARGERGDRALGAAGLGEVWAVLVPVAHVVSGGHWVVPEVESHAALELLGAPELLGMTRAGSRSARAWSTAVRRARLTRAA